MKIFIVDTYYPSFLGALYARLPDLAHRPYVEQWHAIMGQCFGSADFYSSNLRKVGHEATEVVANCEPLQLQWAREHGIESRKFRWTTGLRKRLIPWAQRSQPRDWFYAVLAAQVKQYGPDVLYVQNMNWTSSAFLRQIRPYVRLITGQIACPISSGADFREYDLVLSSFPHFVEQFRRNGLASEHLNLAFEPNILARLEKGETQYGVVFIGGLSAHHAERVQLLEHVVGSHPLACWGYGNNTLNSKSPLFASHHGEAWALDMYNIVYNAYIALNNHISTARCFANNMRLYEATGIGTLLITDQKDNLKTLFEPDKEVVVYSSAEECVELISYYLEHEEEREAIARAGQQRTLTEHTYCHRMRELANILEHHLSQPKRAMRVVSIPTSPGQGPSFTSEKSHRRKS